MEKKSIFFCIWLQFHFARAHGLHTHGLHTHGLHTRMEPLTKNGVYISYLFFVTVYYFTFERLVCLWVVALLRDLVFDAG